MKRIGRLPAVLLLCMLCVSATAAETGAVSIRELPGITSPAWEQSYEAYGRTIDVDVEIFIPDADTAPILTVRNDSLVEEPAKSALEAEYKKADKKDRKHFYEFESEEYSTYVRHGSPLLWGKTKEKNDYNYHTMGQELADLPGYDPDRAYADNNPMTVREAEGIIRTQLRELYPELETKLDTVILEGKTYLRKGKKPIYDKGFYDLQFRQCFRGIPSMACINDTYTCRNHIGKPDGSYTLAEHESGHVFAAVYGEDSWLMNCVLFRETGTVCGDVPLVSFDAVKDRVEALIMSGHVRWINSVTLGYVLFDTRTPEEYLLAPCWVVWCEYHPEGPLSEKVYGVNDGEPMFFGNDRYYRPLIFDAQTGRMFDTENTAEDRLLYPGAQNLQ